MKLPIVSFIIVFMLLCIVNTVGAIEFKEQSGQSAICAWSAKYVVKIPDFQKSLVV